MSETITQANHEMLLGLSRNTNTMTNALEHISGQLQTISQQLLDQTRAAGPTLGLCSPHVAEWIEAGGDPGTTLPGAQTVMMLQGIGALPVCIAHFRAFKAAASGPQLLLPQQGMQQPPGGGLVVPGR